MGVLIGGSKLASLQEPGALFVLHIVPGLLVPLHKFFVLLGYLNSMIPFALHARHNRPGPDVFLLVKAVSRHWAWRAKHVRGLRILDHLVVVR